MLLREGFRWFIDQLNDHAALAGATRLSASAGMLMSYLRPEGVRAADVARRMGVSRQHVHTVVRELLDLGIVTQQSDPRSGRDKIIIPTPAGEHRRRQALDHLADLEREIAGRLGDDELTTLRSLLSRAWGREKPPSSPVDGPWSDD
ncbi:MarR family winged helix-turn-helix transcriptional regulator [Lentzea sp. JNUCC 0626]|uniref:MarR family winged helix-turn-helix transcriptional regulator n=1 Tax=Lentzea sp. JNUCC 0626 TaxID=3367513 RepID=UPI003749D110